MDYSTLDDATLLRLLEQAHTDALGELYDRYNRLVYSIAYAIIGEQATAAEITLDVFTHVWQKAHTYHPERAKVSTWLTAISRNRAIDILRQQSIRPEFNSIGWDGVSVAAVPHVHDLEDEVELTLQRERVRAALAQLPVEQQKVLALAYFKGYTQQQIADTLQQPLGTVKTRVRQAIKKLRQLLQSEQPPFDQVSKSDDPLSTYYNDKN
jgi:RNA polymerase sigma-70 factor (ECF subfamily)